VLSNNLIMSLESGSYLNNRYKILDILGQGGMGAVYRADDENLGIVVAVKENLFTTEEYARQFRREANILASIRHPNLPRVFDHFEIADQGQYLVMDYIVGEDLRQRMDRVGVIDEEAAIISGAAICDALYYLHSRKPVILHRDIKPGNIKIDSEGQSFLVDFGLAKIVRGSEATTTGARAMTPGYSSPEQYGTARTDSRSDVYSLGATLYAAISGNLPEDGLARAMEQVDLTPLRFHNSKISRRVAVVIEKALEIHPEDRYQTAEELKLALLTSRVSTRNIKKTNELTVFPPPEDVVATIELGKELKSKPRSRKEVKMSAESKSRIRKKNKRNTGQTINNMAILFVSGLLLWVLMGLPGINLGSLGNIEVIPITLVESVSENAPTTQGNVIQPTIEKVVMNTHIPTSTNTDIQASNTPEPTEVPPTETEIINPTATVILTSTQIVGAGVSTEIPVIISTDNTDVTNPIVKIYFASSVFGNVQIWQYDSLTAASFQLFDFVGGACQPDSSPDGRKIVFISPCKENSDFYSGTSIYTFDLETKQIENLNLGDSVFDPAWSPAGDMLLYTQGSNRLHLQVMRYDFDTGDIEAFTNSDKVNYKADWSADGKLIVFSSSQNGGFHLYVMANSPSSEKRILSRAGEFDIDPLWVGNEFVLFSKKENEDAFHVATKVSLEMLETSPIDYFDVPINFGSQPLPALGINIHPDMNWIAFESWPDGEHHNIYVSRVDGSERIQITDDKHYDFDPSWGVISTD
jgi:eukaryotic-like serine/threonine-protein kinase